jgi:hypothetical protein
LIVDVDYNAALEPTEVRERTAVRINAGVVLLKRISDELGHEYLVKLPREIHTADVVHRVIGDSQREVDIVLNYVENWFNVGPSFR